MQIKSAGNIEYKVFRKKDIEMLMNFFLLLKKEIIAESTENQTEVILEITFKDDSSITGTDMFSFEDKKEIKEVYFSVKNIYIKKKASISINSKHFYDNKYTVESENEDWVNAKIRKLEEIIEQVRNQNEWLSNDQKQSIIANTVGVLLGAIFTVSLFFQIPATETVAETDIIIYLLIPFLGVVIGMVVSYKVSYNMIFLAYPKIDFDTTQEHLNENAKRKRYIKGFGVLLGIPVLINLLFIVIF